MVCGRFNKNLLAIVWLDSLRTHFLEDALPEMGLRAEGFLVRAGDPQGRRLRPRERRGVLQAGIFLELQAQPVIQRRTEELCNPAIVIIADREDLDIQTSEDFVEAKRFLHENDVRSIEDRKDLMKTLGGRESGGVYITTFQRFSEGIGLLSEHSNIICISDEAHRSQLGVDHKLKKTDKGVFTQYGFAEYLRQASRTQPTAALLELQSMPRSWCSAQWSTATR